MSIPIQNRLLPTILLTALLLLSTACGPGQLIEMVSFSGEVITPNGQAPSALTITYRLSREAKVFIFFVDENNREYLFRNGDERSAGTYNAKFNGTYAPNPPGRERRVMPSGRYKWVVRAVDERGQSEEQQGELIILDADTDAPKITDLIAVPRGISPNGDGKNDELVISYGLSKPAQTELFLTDDKDERYLLEEMNQKDAALQSHRWNGKVGGKLVPDGNYTVHIVAKDAAGNVTESTTSVSVEEGGTPKLEIVEARFTPPTVPLNGDLNVTIRVRNVGDVPLNTLGPPPGTPYTTQMNFNSFRESNDPNAPPLYFERAGYWRVGVDWSVSGRPYPARWGLKKDLNSPLLPGEEAVITGTIKVLIDQTREVFFWASVVQEGVGFPGGQVGQKPIIISY